MLVYRSIIDDRLVNVSVGVVLVVILQKQKDVVVGHGGRLGQHQPQCPLILSHSLSAEVSFLGVAGVIVYP